MPFFSLKAHTFPVHKKLDQCSVYKRKIKLQKRLGKGAYGSVYSACVENRCNYVAKKIDLSKSPYSKKYFGFTLNVFMTEVQITKFAGVNGFGVPLKSHFICLEGKSKKPTGYMIMERFDNTLENVSLTPAQVDSLIKKIEMMHSARILHRDLYPKNVMYQKTSRNDLDIQIIDFGLAIPFKKPIPAQLRVYDFITVLEGLINPANRQQIRKYLSKKFSKSQINQALQWYMEYEKYYKTDGKQKARLCASEHYLLKHFPRHLVYIYGPLINLFFAWSSFCTKNQEELIDQQIDEFPEYQKMWESLEYRKKLRI